jgi:hypothetical protein
VEPQRRSGGFSCGNQDQNPADGVQMSMRTTIRALFAVVTSCALLWMPAVGQAQSTPVPSVTLKQVGANVWAAIDNPAVKGVAAANGGFLIGDDGVAVIDSFASANAAKELLTEIRQRTKLPVKFVINTLSTSRALPPWAAVSNPHHANVITSAHPLLRERCEPTDL